MTNEKLPPEDMHQAAIDLSRLMNRPPELPPTVAPTPPKMYLPRVFRRYEQALDALVTSITGSSVATLSAIDRTELQRYLIATANGEIATGLAQEAETLTKLHQEIIHSPLSEQPAMANRYQSIKAHGYQQRLDTKLHALAESILSEAIPPAQRKKGCIPESEIMPLAHSLHNIHEGAPEFRAFRMMYRAVREEVQQPEAATLAYEAAHPDDGLRARYGLLVEATNWIGGQSWQRRVSSEPKGPGTGRNSVIS